MNCKGGYRNENILSYAAEKPFARWPNAFLPACCYGRVLWSIRSLCELFIRKPSGIRAFEKENVRYTAIHSPGAKRRAPAFLYPNI